MATDRAGFSLLMVLFCTSSCARFGTDLNAFDTAADDMTFHMSDDMGFQQGYPCIGGGFVHPLEDWLSGMKTLALHVSNFHTLKCLFVLCRFTEIACRERGGSTKRVLQRGNTTDSESVLQEMYTQFLSLWKRLPFFAV